MMRVGFIIIGPILMLAMSAQASGNSYPDFKGKTLSDGKSVWLVNCETCHSYGVADAPNPAYPSEWRARIAKGKQVLYGHAINGFFGPDDSMMPARGGNENLSDDEVRAAVDYMVELANFYIQLEDKQDD